jgi:hypothetical protein
VHNLQGEITRAASCSGSEELLFVNQTERNQESSTKLFHLSSNGELFLTVGGRAYHASQNKNPQCATKLSAFLKADQIDYMMTISQETCTTARIIVESRGSVIERTVDFLEAKCTKNDAEIGLCRALGESQKEKLKPFNDLLSLVSDYYWNRAREEIAMLPTLLKNPTDGATPAAWWCVLAHAGCWGLAGFGTGLCCAGTVGVVCGLCGAGFGAGASYCSDETC